MSFKIFSIPILNGQPSEQELNAFLQSHKILSVERHLVNQGGNSFWSFCVDYLERGSGDGPGSKGMGQRHRVDYREVLSPEEFTVFAKLRELRKEMAQREGVPVYTIFNNEQLAQMVQKKVRTKNDLESITGVGDARTEEWNWPSTGWWPGLESSEAPGTRKCYTTVPGLPKTPARLRTPSP
jgi:superfamily II DNA helicase RecQ